MGNMTTRTGGKVFQGQDAQMDSWIHIRRKRIRGENEYSYKERIFIKAVSPANEDKLEKKNTMKLNKKRDELVEEREVKYHRLAAVVHKALDNTPWNL